MKNRSNWVPMTMAALLVVAIPVFLLAAGDATAGKALYDKKCASCHAKDGAGNPGIAKALKVELRHLGSKEVQAKSDDELKQIVTEGTEKKKPVKGLTDDDLANVIAYLRTLAQK
jgi:mono/diheme cytochrome c family protein